MADLMTAKADAAARSLESKKLIFIDIDGEGECSIADKQSATSLHAFQNGNEVPVPVFTEVSKKDKPAKVKVTKAPTKTKSKKKVMAKAATKKAPAKKAAAKPATGLVGRATTILLSKAEWAKVDKAVDDGKGSIRELASKGILKVI
jgi:hypothetical protein